MSKAEKKKIPSWVFTANPKFRLDLRTEMGSLRYQLEGLEQEYSDLLMERQEDSQGALTGMRRGFVIIVEQATRAINSVDQILEEGQLVAEKGGR